MSLSTLENTNYYTEHTVLRFMCIDSLYPFILTEHFRWNWCYSLHIKKIITCTCSVLLGPVENKARNLLMLTIHTRVNHKIQKKTDSPY